MNFDYFTYVVSMFILFRLSFLVSICIGAFDVFQVRCSVKGDKDVVLVVDGALGPNGVGRFRELLEQDHFNGFNLFTFILKSAPVRCTYFQSCTELCCTVWHLSSTQ